MRGVYFYTPHSTTPPVTNTSPDVHWRGICCSVQGRFLSRRPLEWHLWRCCLAPNSKPNDELLFLGTFLLLHFLSNGSLGVILRKPTPSSGTDSPVAKPLIFLSCEACGAQRQRRRRGEWWWVHPAWVYLDLLVFPPKICATFT